MLWLFGEEGQKRPSVDIKPESHSSLFRLAFLLSSMVHLSPLSCVLVGVGSCHEPRLILSSEKRHRKPKLRGRAVRGGLTDRKSVV